MKLYRIAGSAGLLLCWCAFAPQAAEFIAEPVLVTATRTTQPLGQTSATVTIIGRDEIERSQPQNIADLLQRHAGLDVARTGGPGQLTTLFTRGTDSNHTLVLLDGVRINPGTIGGAPLQNIDPALIDRIEIVRGPYSTLYGSDAIGGVMQIFTRRGRQPLSASSYFGTGSDNTYSAGVSGHGYRDNVRAGIDIGYLNSDGFPPRTESQLERGHHNLNANVYLGYESAGWDMELSHWQAKGNTEYLDFFLAPLDQDFNNTVSTVTLRAIPGGIWTPTVKLSHIEDDLQEQQGNDFSRTRRDVLDWQNDFVYGEHQLITAGLYLAREKTDSLSFGAGFDEATDVDAVFVQDQIGVGKHQLLIAARYTDHESFGGHKTWNLAYGYQLAPDTRWFAGVGTAFRAPDATDRFGFGGNPALDPETSRNIEIGIQRKLGRFHSVALSAFQNDIDDLVVFNDPDGFLGPGEGKNANVEQARVRGIEARYDLQHENLTLQVEAIVQDPENRTSGENLARRSERSISANLYYAFGRSGAGMEWLAHSKRKDSNFNNAQLPGYGVLNICLQTRLRDDLMVQGRIENLFDKKYFLADRFNSQDRAFYLTLRYQPKLDTLL